MLNKKKYYNYVSLWLFLEKRKWPPCPESCVGNTEKEQVIETMKKLTSVLLALAMVLSLVTTALAAETTLTVSTPDALPKAGETFTVTVDISGNPGLCSAQFTLSFDKSVVKCESAKLGKVLSGMLSATNPNAPDGAIIACAAVDARTGNGTLAEYTFRVLRSGDAKFALTDGIFTDGAGKSIQTNVKAPAVTKPTTPTTPITPGAGEQAEQGEPGEPAGQGEEAAVQLFEKTSFTDVPASFWGCAYIEKAAGLGLVTGNPDGTFAPDKPMTRAEFVTILRRLSGDTGASPDKGFADVKAGDWFCDAANWAADKGYATGDGVHFNPSGRITRQEVVTILFRYHGGTGGMEAMLGAFGVDNLSAFGDRGAVSSWALDAMHWAVYNGLMNGKSATALEPLSSASRAEITAIFVRYIEKNL